MKKIIDWILVFIVLFFTLMLYWEQNQELKQEKNKVRKCEVSLAYANKVNSGLIKYIFDNPYDHKKFRKYYNALTVDAIFENIKEKGHYNQLLNKGENK